MAGISVIGEIGGTSSRWAFIEGDGSIRMLPNKGEAISGFNPLNGDADQFVANVSAYFKTDLPSYFEHRNVQVYGAGCGSPERTKRMSEALSRIWPTAEIQVDTDILGAAKGLCGNDQGLVLILGTGMSAGYWDGTNLFRPMPSLGYILGDEGSGADIGRATLQDAFYERMPVHLREALFGADGPDLSSVLESIHRSAFPARSLASYTAKISIHKEERYVRELILSRFHAMAELLVLFFTPEQRSNVAATGSVSYGFKELLAECLWDRGMTLTSVEPDPLPGLVRFHQQKS
ncbi:MAG: hypothetical protein WAR83_05325 [Flavobacteriales bacterium]|nr:hypothetical protein [Flavobacteriales bacterium]